MDKRRVKIAIFVPLGIAGFVAFGFLLMLDHLPALAAHGMPLQATVTAKRPQEHSSIVYEYSIGGTTYSGHTGVQDLDAVHIGDSVAITYLSSHPSIAVLGDAQAGYSDWWHAFLMITLSIALIPAALALLVEFTRRPSNQAMQRTAR